MPAEPFLRQRRVLLDESAVKVTACNDDGKARAKIRRDERVPACWLPMIIKVTEVIKQVGSLTLDQLQHPLRATPKVRVTYKGYGVSGSASGAIVAIRTGCRSTGTVITAPMSPAAGS